MGGIITAIFCWVYLLAQMIAAGKMATLLLGGLNDETITNFNRTLKEITGETK